MEEEGLGIHVALLTHEMQRTLTLKHDKWVFIVNVLISSFRKSHFGALTARACFAVIYGAV